MAIRNLTPRHFGALDVLTKAARPMRSTELEAAGVHPQTLRELIAVKRIIRVGPAVYMDSDTAERGRFEDVLVETVLRFGQAMFSLHTAAWIHGLLRVEGGSVEIYVPRRIQGMREDLTVGMRDQPLVAKALLDTRLQFGIQRVDILGVQVRITDPARTVVELLLRARASGERALDALLAREVSGELLVGLLDALDQQRSLDRPEIAELIKRRYRLAVGHGVKVLEAA